MRRNFGLNSSRPSVRGKPTAGAQIARGASCEPLTYREIGTCVFIGAIIAWVALVVSIVSHFPFMDFLDFG